MCSRAAPFRRIWWETFCDKEQSSLVQPPCAGTPGAAGLGYAARGTRDAGLHPTTLHLAWSPRHGQGLPSGAGLGAGRGRTFSKSTTCSRSEKYRLSWSGLNVTVKSCATPGSMTPSTGTTLNTLWPLWFCVPAGGARRSLRPLLPGPAPRPHAQPLLPFLHCPPPHLPDAAGLRPLPPAVLPTPPRPPRGSPTISVLWAGEAARNCGSCCWSLLRVPERLSSRMENLMGSEELFCSCGDPATVSPLHQPPARAASPRPPALPTPASCAAHAPSRPAPQPELPILQEAARRGLCLPEQSLKTRQPSAEPTTSSPTFFPALRLLLLRAPLLGKTPPSALVCTQAPTSARLGGRCPVEGWTPGACAAQKQGGAAGKACLLAREW